MAKVHENTMQAGDGREIVHRAGPQIEFDGVIRQRCVWCGALIDERDLARTAVEVQPGETEEQAVEGLRDTRWEGFVAVAGHVRWAVPEPADGKAPERSCMRIAYGGHGLMALPSLFTMEIGP